MKLSNLSGKPRRRFHALLAVAGCTPESPPPADGGDSGSGQSGAGPVSIVGAGATGELVLRSLRFSRNADVKDVVAAANIRFGAGTFS